MNQELRDDAAIAAAVYVPAHQPEHRHAGWARSDKRHFRIEIQSSHFSPLRCLTPCACNSLASRRSALMRSRSTGSMSVTDSSARSTASMASREAISSLVLELIAPPDAAA